MSRSRKKFPVVKDNDSKSKHRWQQKTLANRAVRRCRDIPSGKAGYKKVYCSWNICDYRFYEYPNEKEFRRAWNNRNKCMGFCRWKYLDRYNSYQEALQDWKKWYIRK